MPQFAPSAVKTARAAITVKPAGLSCQAELYLVSGITKVVTSGLKPFTSTGAAQDITFPVTMPSAEGSYKVYLDIYASGILIAAYQATEDVVIQLPTIPLDGGWTCSGMSYLYIGQEPGAPAWQLRQYACQITSKASITTTKAIAWQRRWQSGGVVGDWWQPGVLYDGTITGVPNPRQITLAPGGVYNFKAIYSEGYGHQVQLRLVDELGNIGGLTGWISV